MATRELLSLLPTFAAIYDEQSLSRAADKLGVSQSAVSQSLARLRQLTSDLLFETTGRGVKPTARAVQMIGHVRAAIIAAQEVERSDCFDPATYDRTFCIDAGIGLDAVFIPKLHREFLASAPKVKLNLFGSRPGDPEKTLPAGDADLAFDFLEPATSELNCQALFLSPIVVISRKDHPIIQSGLTEDLYLSSEHATLNWHRSAAPSWTALELQRLGFKINGKINVPTISSVAAIVSTSDLLATVSEAVAKFLRRGHPIAIHRLPLSLRPGTLYQVWHKRFDDDPAHKLLRGSVARAAVDVAG